MNMNSFGRFKSVMVLASLALALSLMSLVATSSNDGNPAPYGRVDSLNLASHFVKSPIRVNVGLPGAYFTPGSTERFPVLYLLNGHGGNQNSWGTLIPVDSVATAYNMIIITLDGRNSWYWDSPLQPELQMESFITEQLIPYIDENYRTLADRNHRAFTGFSMGGHGAMWLALRHKDLIANVGATSGGVDIMPFPNHWNIQNTLGDYAKNRERWSSHTVMSQLDSIQNGDLNIIIDCGTEDFFFKVNNTLDSTLTARGIEHVYLTSPGMHNGDYWKQSIYPQLDFFKKQFDK